MQRPHADVELQEFKLPQSSSPREGQQRRLTISPTENELINKNLELDHRIANEYSCCFCRQKTDRRLLSFMAQFTFSCLIIIFSIYQLSIENNCPCNDSNFNSFYTSILTGTIGVWMPSPKALS